MGFLSRIRDIFVGPSTKQVATMPYWMADSVESAKWTARRPEDFAEEGYKKNVTAFRATFEVAQDFSSITWVLRRRTRDSFEDIVDHPLLELFRRPNPFMAWPQLTFRLAASYILAGNAYLRVVSPENRPPMELQALLPHHVTLEFDERSGVPTTYVYDRGSSERNVIRFPIDPLTGESELLHVQTFNPFSHFVGMSFLEAAAYSIDIHNGTSEWNKSLLDKGGRPWVAVRLGYELNETQLERYRKNFSERYSGRSAERIMLLEPGQEIQSIGLSPVDMDFINSRHTTERDIAFAIGGSGMPFLLGLPGTATYNNVREARMAIWEETVLPMANIFREEFNRWLVPKWGDPDLFLTFDEDTISALAPRREARWNAVEKADWLTINEKREATGYEPIEGGDVILVPASMVPLEAEADVGTAVGNATTRSDDGQPDADTADDIGDHDCADAAGVMDADEPQKDEAECSTFADRVV